MDDKELYRQILGIVKPWEIIKIDLDMSKQEVNIYLEYPLPSAGICPKCGKTCPVYDKREERIWRHLETCQLRTFIHCQTPRITCSEHKAITMDVPWSSNMRNKSIYLSPHAATFLVERRLLRLRLTSSILAHERLARVHRSGWRCRASM